MGKRKRLEVMDEYPYLIGEQPVPVGPHIGAAAAWGGAWAMLTFAICTYLQGSIYTVAQFGGALSYVIASVVFFLLGAVIGSIVMCILTLEV